MYECKIHSYYDVCMYVCMYVCNIHSSLSGGGIHLIDDRQESAKVCCFVWTSRWPRVHPSLLLRISLWYGCRSTMNAGLGALSKTVCFFSPSVSMYNRISWGFWSVSTSSHRGRLHCSVGSQNNNCNLWIQFKEFSELWMNIHIF